MRQDAVVLLDVREADERDEGYIAGSRHIPYRLLPAVSDGLADRTVDHDLQHRRQSGIAASVLAARGVDARPGPQRRRRRLATARRPHDRIPPLRLVSDGMTTSSGNAVARELFAPLGPTYDRYARLLSLGQDPRWRRFLVSRVSVAPTETVLDVASGTAAVAIELARRTGCSVVGLDQSDEMLTTGRQRVDRAGLAERVRLVHGNAEQLPFPDGEFDALTFTYLLRYVDDLRRDHARACTRDAQRRDDRFARVRGPSRALWRMLWELYVRLALPLAGRVISAGWHDVGRFLGPSIRALPPPEQLAELWRDSGITDVRFRRLSFGGGVVMWGRRE